MYAHRRPAIARSFYYLLVISIFLTLSCLFNTANGEVPLSSTPNEQSDIAPLEDKLIEEESASEEYDEETGEPRCGSCHTGDRRPAIDYTSDPECLQCHSNDYSERFLSIDERYKLHEEETAKSYRHYARADPPKMPEKTTAKKPNKKITIPESMVLVPAGVFLIGADDWWPKSQPQHERELPDYFVDKYEVTNRDYNGFINATGHHKPDHWRSGRLPPGRDSHPVTYVDWFDSKAYCEWKGKRLPTEPEWEKAARGTAGRVFPWGDEFGKNKANTPQYGNQGTMPVGSFENGKSPYGAYDMAGNIFEWTSDWYKAYPGNQHPDPNEGERYRVVRGGSWYDCTFYKCGISAPTFNRIFFNPYTKNHNFGFRCVKDAE